MIGRVLAGLVVLLAWPALAAAQLAGAFLQTAESDVALTTYTFTSQNFGAAATDRGIVVVSLARKGSTATCTTPTVTIGGIAATHIVSVGNNIPSSCNVAAIHKALVPSGTTGTVALTYPAAMLRAHIAVYRMTGPGALVAAASGSSSATDPTGTLTIAGGGYAIGGSMTTLVAGGVTAAWAGLTEQFDAAMTGSTANFATGASLAPGVDQPDLPVTVNWSDGATSVGVWAAWNPYVAASSPTHYVTPTGNTGGLCSVGDPCTLTRAFEIAGGATIPPGSWVSVAAGIYSQAGITTINGGVAGAPIRFVGAGDNTTSGSRITGTRTSFPAASWSLCAASTYSYCATFDEATNYTVEQFAQRPGPLLTTWVDITVDDRQAGNGWVPSGRAFTLNEPVSYTRVGSAGGVEAQHCTFYHNTTTNTLYMHPCREAVPTDGDQYYGGPDGWGTVTFTGNGDYLSLENVSVEHTGSDAGIYIEDTATGTNLDEIRMLSTPLWIYGRQTTGTDIFITEVITQGSPDAQCYSLQYGGQGLASRSCWNAFADGNALVFGLEDGGITHNGSLDRITLERGWNGFTMNGPNTMDHALVWGFGNHVGQTSGSNVTIRNSIFLNGQDVMFEADDDWANHVYEHNIFYNFALWYCGRSGSQNGITCPTSWSMRYNLLTSVNTDWMNEPTLTRDCNVWMSRPAGSNLLLITQVGGSHNDYTTLAQIRAATANDDNSISYESGTKWSDGSIFANFTSQQTYPVDFSLAPTGAAALTTCGVRAGPDTLTADVPAETTAVRFRYLVAAPPPVVGDDVYFRLNCTGAWPQCGMDQNINIAEMGTTWNMTQQVGAGPQGQTAARFSWPGPSPVGEEYFGWRENNAPIITQGASVFIRYKIRFGAPQTVGTAGVKLFILGDSDGADGDRVIGTLKYGCTSSTCWNFDIDKNINGTRVAFTNLAPSVWHSIQAEIDTSSTTIATNGQFKLWVNTDVYASPSDTRTGLVLPATYAGELGVGFFGNTTDGGANAVYDFCCFEYGPTFDNTWLTGGRFWSP